MDQAQLWYGVIFLLIAIYALLDGFDLGVGILHLLANSRERLLLMRAIGPFYDGNEVWLIIFEQVLMAIFPEAYGAIFSGLYFPVLVLTASLVLRVLALEFRHSSENQRWAVLWDSIFFSASLLAALSFGAMLGYLALGMPLTPDGDLDDAKMRWIRSLPILAGLVVASLFALHGSSYLIFKVRGAFQVKVRKWAFALWSICPIFLLITLKSAALSAPHLLVFWQTSRSALSLFLVLGPLLWTLHLLALIKNKPVACFICSGGLIWWAIAAFALSHFPYLVLASNDQMLSITALNAISSPLSRGFLAPVLALGIPLVLTYTGTIYWFLRAPVLDEGNDYYA